MHFENVRDVESFGETPEAYRCTVDLVWTDEETGEITSRETVPVVARQGASGVAGHVWDAIERGEYGGEIADFQVPFTARQRRKLDQARAAYEAVLERGFEDGEGVRWAATGGARDRILDLTQHIQEYRADKASSELPAGKATVRLRDASDAPHDVSPSKILALAEKGDDFKQLAQDRLEQIRDEVDAATSQADLDAIDVTTGWPA
jgi:hypothetical protein